MYKLTLIPSISFKNYYRLDILIFESSFLNNLRNCSLIEHTRDPKHFIDTQIHTHNVTYFYLKTQQFFFNLLEESIIDP